MNRRFWIAIVCMISLTGAVFAGETKELTLDGAVEQALKNNLDIQISRTAYDQARTDIMSARSIYDLQFTLNFEHSDTTRAPRTALDASSEKQDFLSASLRQKLSTGATLTFTTTNYKYKTLGFQFSLLNPVYGSNFRLRIDQPIWNGFGRDNVEYTINLNRQYSERAMEQLKDTINRLISQTESAYLDLVYSARNLTVAKETLALAQEQLNITRKKVEVGTLAPVDQLQSEANLADARQKLVAAENLMMAAQDQLKKILNLKPEEWDVQFQPQPVSDFQLQQYDYETCLKKALEQNPSIRMARIDLGISDMTLDYRRNQTKPSVNVYGTVSYDGNNSRSFVDANGQLVIFPGSFGDALDMATSLDNQSWSVGINVTYPIQNRAAKAGYMRARLEKTSRRLTLENTVIAVTNEIRDALRNMKSSLRSIEAATKTRELRKTNLEIEKKKFINGMSTNFLVSQREEELAQARIAELNARIGYQKALISLKKAMGTLLDDRNIVFQTPEP